MSSWAESAALPAVYAATSPDSKSGYSYGPGGFLHFRGAPAEQTLYARLQSPEDSRKIWELSERLVGVNLPRLISR
jgi:hypothetical protein